MIRSAELFAPVSKLFLAVPTSDLQSYVQEAHDVVVGFPGLLALIDADLDAHGRSKKALRLEDEAWVAAQTACLLGFAPAPAEIDPRRLELTQGRPRTPAYVVLIALLLRGYCGAGFKSCDVTTLMQESVTLQVIFRNLGLKMPGRSTLTELVNAVTNATRRRILDAQIARVAGLRWDDFSTMLQDSTHVEGNTKWPTDSRLIVTLTARMLRIGAALPRLELPALVAPKAHGHLAAMAKLDREIDLMPATKERPRQRRKRYGKLLWRAQRVRVELHDAIVKVEAAFTTLDVLPSRKAMAGRAVVRLRSDHDALAQMIVNCEARVVREEEVPACDKQFSASDPDVGFIAKGQRVPVVGYKPQVARSGNGFLTGLLLPQGNAADSGQLVPMIDEVVARTGVVPKVLSVDDGYSSKENFEAAKALKIEVISMNGAKGRALTPREDWESEPYAQARNGRSAVESIIFTLKQGFDFDHVARRGLDAAYGELLEKALAYNLCHMVRTRRALEGAAAKSHEDAVPKLAA